MRVLRDRQAGIRPLSSALTSDKSFLACSLAILLWGPQVPDVWLFTLSWLPKEKIANPRPIPYDAWAIAVGLF